MLEWGRLTVFSRSQLHAATENTETMVSITARIGALLIERARSGLVFPALLQRTQGLAAWTLPITDRIKFVCPRWKGSRECGAFLLGDKQLSRVVSQTGA